MLDNKLLREDLDAVVNKLRMKNFTLDKQTYTTFESTRKELQSITEKLQQDRNSLAKEIGIAKKQKLDTTELMRKGNEVSKKLSETETQLKAHQKDFQDFLSSIPNLVHDSTPRGSSEDDNVVINKYGTPRNIDFEVKDHVSLCSASKQLDFEAGSNLSGSRFVVLQADIALLNRALINYMLDTHTKTFNYLETNTPVLVNEKALFGTGQLPKFRDDQFFTNSEHNLALIPTAEVTLTNLLRDTQLDEATLPRKLCAYSLCFRKEAGSYGKDTRGMLRMHQFEKVELVQVVHPSASYEALEDLTSNAEHILKTLELPFQRVSLCGGDLGFSAAKTYDLEVWLPSQNTYREISSCSNTECFQARRMNIKIKCKNNKKPIFAHCLNGSGLAIGRTLLAILENYQQADGSVEIPKVLIPYMHGKTKIIL